MRSASQSLYTTLLAAVDIGLGSVLYQSLSTSVGLLLVGIGLLVLVATVSDLFAKRPARSGSGLDQLTPE